MFYFGIFSVLCVILVVIGTHTSSTKFWPSRAFIKYINVCQRIKALNGQNIVQLVGMLIITEKTTTTQKLTKQNKNK